MRAVLTIIAALSVASACSAQLPTLHEQCVMEPFSKRSERCELEISRVAVRDIVVTRLQSLAHTVDYSRSPVEVERARSEAARLQAVAEASHQMDMASCRKRPI
jgi:hypothetical protein